MAVSPINIARVSQNLQTNFVLSSLRRTQRDLFLAQTQIATGRSFVTPSENPIAAGRALDFSQALARQEQFVANVQYGDSLLAAADSALSELNSLLVDASSIASQNVSNLTGADERLSEAEVVAAIRRQVQSVANRRFNGRYIFGGRSTVSLPFIDALGGVAYVGDLGFLRTRVDTHQTAQISTPGNEVFGGLSRSVQGGVDLTPVLRETVRLDALNGATGEGIRLGTLVFREGEGEGATTFLVDLSGADTIGDVADRITQAAQDAGASVTASIGERGLVIQSNGPVTIGDRSGGEIAASLGLLVTEPTSGEIGGADLGVRITPQTAVEDLAGGEGIDLEGGLLITNGERTVTVDLSGAKTVQDVLNAINTAGVFVLARINEAGTGIDLYNQVSGSALRIGENGGTTATDLGIRTMSPSTPLSELNAGVGVTAVEGQEDFRITARDGSTVDVNLDGAQTIGDVIDLINAAAEEAGVSVEASLAETGNGIRITDSTSGSGNLSVTLLNASPAAVQLGLLKTVTDPEAALVGDDVRPVRTDGIMDALFQLEQALRNDDTQGITEAADRLDQLRNELVRQQGIVGARSQGITQKRRQIEDAKVVTQRFLSEIQDLDYAEATTKLQQTLTQFQANLQVGSALLNLSLLDFLR